ncbi:MAG TPA: alanine racemase [Trueperaceae bacterium]|nr:alanine racemase [Trueperaceae bacterium]
MQDGAQPRGTGRGTPRGDRTGDDAGLEGPVATIDLAALEHNLTRLRSYLRPETGVLAAVKADAYGHGAAAVAARLQRAGVTWFGVATPREALALREAGIDDDILLFGPVYDGATVRRLADADVALTLADADGLAALQAARAGRAVRVHLKVDTGMGRLGLPWPRAARVAQAADRAADIALEGVWTHLARADEPGRSPTLTQLERFERLLAALRQDGIEPGLRHVANSAGLIAFPEAHYDLVRPGIGLYGYHSGDAVAALEQDLRPVMRLRAPVTFVKRVGAGTPVSYGGTWAADEETTIATVRAGYADGYPRLLSSKGTAGLHGRQVSVVGRVCMDQLMLDAGDLDVRPGDIVTLWGPLPGPTAESLARGIGTIAYELLTRVSPRVPRRYLG